MRVRERIAPVAYFVATSVVAAVLLFGHPSGAARAVVVTIGDVVVATSLMLAVRRYRPLHPRLWTMIVASAWVLTLESALFRWTQGDAPLARTVGLVLAVVINIPTPVALFWSAMPYLRTRALWERMVPIMTYALMLPVVNLAALIGGRIDVPLVAAVVVSTFVLGLVLIGPTVWRLGRIADVLLYACTGVIFVVIVVYFRRFPDQVSVDPAGQYAFMACVGAAAWHPSMKWCATPLPIENDLGYEHHRTTWIAVFCVIEASLFAAFNLHNAIAVIVAALVIVAAIGHTAWTVVTGRSPAGDLSMMWALRGAVARHEIIPALQPLVGASGTELGSIVWARWDHRRRGMLPASEWWYVARRIELTASVESVVLRTLLDRVATMTTDYGILVVTLDDPSRHEAALRRLGEHGAVVVRCDRGFEAVRAAGCRLATSIEVAVAAQADIIEIPVSVSLWATSGRGADVVAGLVAAARNMGVMTLAVGVEAAAMRAVAADAGVDLLCGYDTGRPQIIRLDPPAPVQRGD